MFGNNQNNTRYSLFGNRQNVPQLGLFGNRPPTDSHGLFGRRQPQRPQKIETKLFTDKQGPWHNASEEISSFFDEESRQRNIVKISKIRYSQKIAPTYESKLNVCHISCETPHYLCWTCIRKRKQKNQDFGICMECFDEQEHETHIYEKFNSNSSGLFGSNSIQCGCGKDLFEEEGQDYACKMHCKQVQKIGLEKEELEHFISFWSTLFDIYHYLELEGNHKSAFSIIGELIYAELHFLAEKHIRNIRMIEQLFKKSTPIKLIDQKLNIFQLFMVKEREELTNCKSLQLLQVCFSDMQFAHAYTDTLIQLNKESSLKIKVGYSTKQAELIRYNYELSYKLFVNNITEMFNVEETALICRKSKNPQILANYVASLAQKKTSDSLFINWVIKLFGFIKNGRLVKRSAQILLPNILSILQMSQEQKESQEKKDSDEEDNSQKDLVKNLLHDNTFRKFLNKLIFSYCDGSPKKILEFPQIIDELFKPLQLEKEKKEKGTKKYLDILGDFIMHCIKETNSISYPHAMLAIAHPRKSDFFGEFYEKAFERTSGSLFSPGNLDYQYSKFIYLVVLIVHHRFYFQRFQDPDIQTEEELQPERQYREELLRQCIYEIKCIENIQTLKSEFRIPNFDKIIKQMMSYNFTERKFYFKQNCEHPNKLALILSGIFGSNQEQNFLSSFNIESSKHFEKLTQFEFYLAQEILVKSPIYLKMELFWQQVRSKNSHEVDYFKEKNFSAKYLQTLILIDILGKGKHQEVKRRLSQIKGCQKQIDVLYKYGRKESIDFLLCIYPEEKLEVENQESSESISPKVQVNEEEEEKKRAFLQKRELAKKEKYAKIKLKQEACIERFNKLATESFHKQISEEGQQCILCHEKGKKNNRLVYLMKIITKYTECKVLFGDCNKAQTKASSCFHPMHFNCFMSEYEKFPIKKCPLCSKSINAILPLNYHPEQKKMNRICTNIIVNSFFLEYKVYDIQNLFIILFRHLIESKSFSSLINIHRYEQNRRRREKIDFFIETFMTEMYELASKEVREQYDQSLNNFMQEIRKTENSEFGEIQEMFAMGLKDKLMNNGNRQSLKLIELADRLRQQEFMIIKNEAEDIGVFMPEKEEMTEKEMSDQSARVKLSKQYPLKPPKYTYQLRSFGKKDCQYCQRPKGILCLICGITMCGTCEPSQTHKKNHQEKMLSFLFSQSTIEFTNEYNPTAQNIFSSQNSDKSQSLYYNDIMVEFSRMNYPNTHKDCFMLNEEVYARFQGYLFN